MFSINQSKSSINLMVISAGRAGLLLSSNPNQTLQALDVRKESFRAPVVSVVSVKA
jgi:hypothetical protein